MKGKFKITHEVHSAITKLATELPEMYKTDKNQNPLYRTEGARIIGSAIDKNQRHNIKDWSPDTVYVVQKKIPLTVNHRIEMLAMYKSKGNEGVKNYLDMIKFVVSASELKKQKDWDDKNLFQKFLTFVKIKG